MSHAVADCFQIADRGYIREGYYADLVIVDPQKTFSIAKENIFAQMRLESFGRVSFPDRHYTYLYVNGHLVYGNTEVE